MHGISFAASLMKPGWQVWNPGQERPTKLITCERLDAVTTQIQEAADQLVMLEYDIRNAG